MPFLCDHRHNPDNSACYRDLGPTIIACVVLVHAHTYVHVRVCVSQISMCISAAICPTSDAVSRMPMVTKLETRSSR